MSNSLVTTLEALAMLQPEDDPALTAAAQTAFCDVALPVLSAACIAAVNPAHSQVIVPLVRGVVGGNTHIPLSVAFSNPDAAFGALLPAHRPAVASMIAAPAGTLAQSLAPAAAALAVTALRAIGPAAAPTGASQRPLQPQLASMVSTVCRSALLNPDHKFRASACTLAAIALRRYGAGIVVPSLNASEGSDALSLSDLLRLIASTFESGDEASCAAAPLITAATRCSFEAGAAVGAEAATVLITLSVQRLARDTKPSPSLVVRLLMAVAYLILTAPGPVCVILARTALSIDARSKFAPPLSSAAQDALFKAVTAGHDVTITQTAAAIVLRAWCAFHDVLSMSRIVERTVKLAFMRLIEQQASDPSLILAVQSETVPGPAALVDSAAAGIKGSVTRSKAKALGLLHETAVTPLPVRAFALLVSDWLEAADMKDEDALGALDDDEEGDASDDDDAEDGDEKESDDDDDGSEDDGADGHKKKGSGRRPFMDANVAAALYGHFDDDDDVTGGARRPAGISARDIVDLNDLLAGGWEGYFGKNGNDDEEDEDEDGAHREAVEDFEVWSELQETGESRGASEEASLPPIPLDPVLLHVSAPEASLAAVGATTFGALLARMQSVGGGSSSEVLMQVLRAATMSLDADAQKKLFARMPVRG